jgi:hypothetical protein
MNTTFQPENLKEDDHMESVAVYGKIVFLCIMKKVHVRRQA